MENNKCGCECEDTESMEKSVKDNSNETKEGKPTEDNECNCGCEDEGSVDKLEEGECGCEEECMTESSKDEPEESTGCGCGCGAAEYVDVDKSLIANPDEPKFMVDDNFIKEFENYAYSIGIKSIGYTQVTPELLINDKFIQYPYAIVLTMEMDKEIIDRSRPRSTKTE